MLPALFRRELAGHLPGLGGQAAPGGRLRVIELLLCGAALLFHNASSFLVLEAIVNGRDSREGNASVTDGRDASPRRPGVVLTGSGRLGEATLPLLARRH